MEIKETIFLTGFPGFIGGRLIRRLANPQTQFFLLVQRHLVRIALPEIQKISKETQTPLENFAVVEGDLVREDLYINAEDRATIINETTSVFHLAAVYDLDVPKDLAYQVNVEGTKNLNLLIKEIKNLRRYNYVSTCYVAGKRKGLIREDELEHDEGFRNFYEETKYFAEIEVAKMKADFPVTIYRPSVVCGDSKTGETAKYDGIYYVVNYLRIFPKLLSAVNIGNRKVRLNLVPVDFVVESIATLATNEGALGKTIQLADPHPLTTFELCNAVAKNVGGFESSFTLPMPVMQQILLLPTTPVLTGMPNSGVPYFFTEQSYDTSIGEDLLTPHGIACPNFNNYVKNLVEFVEKHPKLKQ